MTRFSIGAQRFTSTIVALAALLLLTPAPSHAAAKIQRLVSPGGIEAWFVQDATVPLIAMEYAFKGGSSQDPADKPGTGNMVASLLDEGAADLDSKTFHERLDRRAIELSFSSTRDYFRGQLRMLKDNKDEAFDLLQLALTSARFDAADVERIRAQVISGLRRETTNPSSLASRKFLEVAFGDHPYGRPSNGTLDSVPDINVSDMKAYAGRIIARDSLRISVVGDIDADTLGKLLDKTFGGLPAKGQPDAGRRNPGRPTAAARLRSARRAANRGHVRRPRHPPPRSEFHDRLCREPYPRRRIIVAALQGSPRKTRAGLFDQRIPALDGPFGLVRRQYRHPRRPRR